MQKGWLLPQHSTNTLGLACLPCRQSKSEAQATSQDRRNFSEKRQQVDTAGVPFSLKGLPKTSYVGVIWIWTFKDFYLSALTYRQSEQSPRRPLTLHGR